MIIMEESVSGIDTMIANMEMSRVTRNVFAILWIAGGRLPKTPVLSLKTWQSALGDYLRQLLNEMLQIAFPQILLIIKINGVIANVTTMFALGIIGTKEENSLFPEIIIRLSNFIADQ